MFRKHEYIFYAFYGIILHIMMCLCVHIMYTQTLRTPTFDAPNIIVAVKSSFTYEKIQDHLWFLGKAHFERIFRLIGADLSQPLAEWLVTLFFCGFYRILQQQTFSI